MVLMVGWWPRGMVAQGSRWEVLGDRGMSSGSNDGNMIEILTEYLENRWLDRLVVSMQGLDV